MKKILGTLGIILNLSLAAVYAQATTNSAETLYKQAYTSETVEHNPTEAIAMYQKVLSLTADESELAARSHFRLGICYEKLGKNSEALNAYEEVLNLPDAPEGVTRQAHDRVQRLSEMTHLQPAEPVIATPVPEAVRPRTEIIEATPSKPTEPFDDRRTELSLNLGHALTTGDYGSVFNQSNVLGGSFNYQVSSFFALGFDLNCSFRHSAKDAAYEAYDFGDSQFSAAHHFNERILQASPSIRIGSWTGSKEQVVRWMPYAIFSFGAYWEHLDETVDYANYTNYVVTSSGHYEETLGDPLHFGVSGGLGLSARIQQRYLIGFEARYHRVFTGKFDFKPYGGDIQYVTPALKIGLLF